MDELVSEELLCDVGLDDIVLLVGNVDNDEHKDEVKEGVVEHREKEWEDD